MFTNTFTPKANEARANFLRANPYLTRREFDESLKASVIRFAISTGLIGFLTTLAAVPVL